MKARAELHVNPDDYNRPNLRAFAQASTSFEGKLVIRDVNYTGVFLNNTEMEEFIQYDIEIHISPDLSPREIVKFSELSKKKWEKSSS